MPYRITVEEKGEDTPNGYENWKQIYQQSVNDLDVSEMIIYVNEPLRMMFGVPQLIDPAEYINSKKHPKKSQ